MPDQPSSNGNRKTRPYYSKHGMTHTRAYIVWGNIIQRCCNEKCPSWFRYGGRGITVCERWMNSENFLADMGEPAPGMTIERKDNSKGYYKENCRWATRKEQNRNMRRNHMIEFGEFRGCMSDAAVHFGISLDAIRARLRRGWSMSKTLTEPVRKPGREHL